MKTPNEGAPVPCLRLGDTGYGVVGAGLTIVPMGDGTVALAVAVTGGRASELVPMEPTTVIVGELMRFTDKQLAGLLQAGTTAPEAPEGGPQ